MQRIYNQIAGGSLERIAALSDGLFAFGMTLLVLDLKLPEKNLVHSEAQLASALADNSERLIVFAMSFLTLGIFWTGQQTQLTQLARGNRNLGWLHLTFLFSVAIVPFTTKLLAEFIHLRLALIVYWINILALGATLYLSWGYAVRAGLVKADISSSISTAIKHRILIAQALYAIGAALCVWNIHISIGFIILLQLYYAVAPTLSWGRSKSARPKSP